MEIYTENLKVAEPLYNKYPDEFYPEPAYIELDCRDEGSLFADWSGIGKALPVYVFNGYAVRWYVDAGTAGPKLEELFCNEAFLDCCQRIIGGFHDTWDGRNMVGRYSDDATEAIDAAKSIIASLITVVQRPGTRKRKSAIRRRPVARPPAGDLRKNHHSRHF